MDQKVRTRFAPSPTGTPDGIHLGFVIRALWNYAYSKKNHGQFILRIEDTDRKRSRKDTEEEIVKVLHKFNIRWDEGPDIGGPYAPYRQSDRLDKYKKAAELLVERGYAYYDFEAPKREKEEIKDAYQLKEKLVELKIRPKARENNPQESLERVKKGEPYVVRVKIPEDRVFEYDDWILRKKVKFIGEEVPDLILLKSDGFPTYHLAVVVDDMDMQITHVFRGQEWISSTPIHLFLYEGLQYPLPIIGHFSVIVDPRTGKKFSKRDLTAMFGVYTWLNQGYLPEAILNYLMLLGWAPKDNRELFSLDEFVEAFDQSGLQKANPTFNANKLDWFNGYYIRQKSDAELAELLIPFAPENVDRRLLNIITPLIKERIKKLSDFDAIAGFFFREPEVDNSLFGENYKKHLVSAISVLEKVDGWQKAKIDESLLETVKNNSYHTGKFFMDLRIALTGSKTTPPVNDSIIILGKDATLSRLKKAVQ